MNRRKRILQWRNVLLLILFARCFLPVSAQSQKLDPFTAAAKGHGTISSAVDELKITSALVVLREDGTVLITVCAEMQLQAEGTWKASNSSPDEILLKITGGVVKGEMIGSGKLLLTSDRKSFRQLAVNVKTADGREIKVAFAIDDPEPLSKDQAMTRLSVQVLI